MHYGAYDMGREGENNVDFSVSLNGGLFTINGPIASTDAPTQTDHLTRKDYVDTMLPLAGGTMTGSLTVRSGSNSEIRVSSTEVDSGYPQFRLENSDGTLLTLLETSITHKTLSLMIRDNGTTVGTLKLEPDGNVALLNGLTPTASSHLTRKDYVDKRVLNNDANTAITAMTSLTQAEYDALTPNPATLYVIVG